MKTEEIFQFPVDNSVPEPPRTVDIDPDSTLAFKVHYNDSTYNTQMKAERKQYFAAEPFVFNVQAKLNDKEEVSIRLPLNDAGYVSSGKYIIRSNNTETGTLVPHSIELIGYQGPLGALYGGFDQELRSPENNDTAGYYFTLVMEIDSMNRQEHLITGFIDTLLVVKKDDPGMQILITDGEFAVLYNHFEISIDGVLEIPDGEFNGQPYDQSSNGGWGEFWQFIWTDGRVFSYSWDAAIWTAERIDLFNANKAKGTYNIPYPGDIYWGIGYFDQAYTFYILPSDTLTINLENFNTGQFAKGSLMFKGRELDLVTGTTFASGAPEHQIEVHFAYRDLR